MVLSRYIIMHLLSVFGTLLINNKLVRFINKIDYSDLFPIICLIILAHDQYFIKIVFSKKKSCQVFFFLQGLP